MLIDALHKHRTRSLLDVLDTALGARRQPLIWIITTAGDDNPESVYAAENDYAIKVLEGTIEDDNVFAFILDQSTRMTAGTTRRRGPRPNLPRRVPLSSTICPSRLRLQPSHRARWSPSSGCV